jgi:hypothetical protein
MTISQPIGTHDMSRDIEVGNPKQKTQSIQGYRKTIRVAEDGSLKNETVAQWSIVGRCQRKFA